MGYSTSEYAAFNKAKKSGNALANLSSEKSKTKLFSFLAFPVALPKSIFSKGKQEPSFMLGREGYSKPKQPKLTKDEKRYKKYIDKQRKLAKKEQEKNKIKREFDETAQLRADVAKNTVSGKSKKVKQRKPGEPYHKMHVKNPVPATKGKISSKQKKASKKLADEMASFISRRTRGTGFTESNPYRSRNDVAKRASSLRGRIKSIG